MSQRPTLTQIRQLPRYLERPVPAAYEDANGHMNVTGYLRLHDDAAWPWMASLGLDESYLVERRMSLFDMEHHLRYLAEMQVGDVAVVHGQLLGHTDKVVHCLWYLVDETNQQLSNTFEFLAAHVSLDTRAVTPFPPDVIEAMDELLEHHRALPWTAATTGVLRLRERGVEGRPERVS